MWKRVVGNKAHIQGSEMRPGLEEGGRLVVDTMRGLRPLVT